MIFKGDVMIKGVIDKVANRIGDGKTERVELHKGEFFDGGEVTVAIQKLTLLQAEKLGLDTETQRRRLYCEGKYFKDGSEIHFSIIDYGDGRWEVKQVEAYSMPDTWSISSSSFTGLVSSEELYRNLEDVFARL
jgi:hypothetical protein